MTKVYFRHYYDKFLIVAEGHSGFAENGKDVVCAGVSTLLYTLLNTLLDEESSDRVRIMRNIVRDGYMSIEFEAFDYAKERVNGIVDACITGLQMLAEAYPHNVRME